MDPLRDIVKLETYYIYPNAVGYRERQKSSVTLTLSCGHTTVCKGSKAPKKRARCWRCGLDAYDDRTVGV